MSKTKQLLELSIEYSRGIITKNELKHLLNDENKLKTVIDISNYFDDGFRELFKYKTALYNKNKYIHDR